MLASRPEFDIGESLLGHHEVDSTGREESQMIPTVHGQILFVFSLELVERFIVVAFNPACGRNINALVIASMPYSSFSR